MVRLVKRTPKRITSDTEVVVRTVVTGVAAEAGVVAVVVIVP